MSDVFNIPVAQKGIVPGLTPVDQLETPEIQEGSVLSAGNVVHTPGLLPEPIYDDTPVPFNEVFKASAKRVLSHPVKLMAASGFTAKGGAIAGTMICGAPLCTGVGGLVGFAAPMLFATTATAAIAKTKDNNDEFSYVVSSDKEVRSEGDFTKGAIEGMTSGVYVPEGDETVSRAFGEIAGNIGTMVAMQMAFSVPAVKAVADVSTKPASTLVKSITTGLPVNLAMSIQRTVEETNNSLNNGSTAETAAKVAAVTGFNTLVSGTLFFNMMPGFQSSMIRKFSSKAAESPFVSYVQAGANFAGYDVSEKALHNLAVDGFAAMTGEEIAEKKEITLSDAMITAGAGFFLAGTAGSLGKFLKHTGSKAFNAISGAFDKMAAKKEVIGEGTVLIDEATKAIEKETKDVFMKAASDSMTLSKQVGESVRGSVGAKAIADINVPKSEQLRIITALREHIAKNGRSKKSFSDFFNNPDNNVDINYLGDTNIEMFIRTAGNLKKYKEFIK